MARRLPSKPPLSSDSCPLDSGQLALPPTDMHIPVSMLFFGQCLLPSPVLDLSATPLLSGLVIIVQLREGEHKIPSTSAVVPDLWKQIGFKPNHSRHLQGQGARLEPCAERRVAWDLSASLWKIKLQPTPGLSCRVPDFSHDSRCAHASGWNKPKNLSNMPTPFPLLHRDYTHPPRTFPPLL